MAENMTDILTNLEDQKRFLRCNSKIDELNKDHLINLIKNIMVKVPESMKIIEEY